jgi:type I restriction enzyme S subunit
MNMLTNEASHEVRDMVGSYALGEAVDGTVPPGYKRTEVGVIPGDWDVLPLGEFARLQRGFDLPHRLRREGDVPIISSSGISGTHDRAMVSAPGVVTGRYGTIGEVFFVAEDYWPLNTTLFVKDFKGNDPLFVSLLLRTIDFSSHSGKSGVPGVNRNDLHQERIVRPTLTDQRAIAAALSDVDALLAKLDQLIAKKRDLKQAAMQQLLHGYARLPGYASSWQATLLGRIGRFSKGRGIRKDQVRQDGLPCIRYGEIYTRHHDIVRNYGSFVSPEIAKQSQCLRSGDLLFAGSGETAEEIGKCVAFLDDCEAYAGGDIIILSPVGQDSRFLAYLMNQPAVAAQKARAGQGDAVVHISAKNLAQIELKLPERDEQAAIATVLSDMDAELAALEARRAKTDELKQGMMQALLTGRIRLI